jgi:fructosamine-3-kinase
MDMRDNDYHKAWIKAINASLKTDAVLQHVGVIGGGSINDARRINTSRGVFFLKLNDADAYPGMFEAEGKGLAFLAEHSSFEIPGLVATGHTLDKQWIIMQHITAGSKKDDYWEAFGRRLAEMHQKTHENFGLDYNNYLGSLPQRNTPTESWPAFFAEHRIMPQLEMAKDKALASSEVVRLCEKLCSRAERYFPAEPSAALHGDLWTGNFMTTSNGDATIFDPAAYFGHREMDIGMSRLFGSFDPKFYGAYNEVFPLESGWEERIHVANLYPLMAHLNIFGASYTSQIISILRKYL